MRVAVCTNRRAWDGFVADAGGSLLQSWQWGELRRRQGWQTLRLVALQGNEPRGAMQILARPFYGLGGFFYAAEGPVIADHDWAVGAAPLAPLLAEARRRARAYGALTLRLDPLSAEPAVPSVLAAHGLRRSPDNVQPAATAVVDLAKSEDDLLAGLDRGARYQLRYVRRKGVTVRDGDAADVPALARMIAATGQRKGFGIRNETYLRQLYDVLCARGDGDFYVAEMEGGTLASMIAVPFGPRYFALYAASNDVGRKLGAQYLLHWEAILRARIHGCLRYDFRGVGATANNTAQGWEGLTFFKKRFGTRREELPGAWDDVYRPVAYRGLLAANNLRQAAPLRGKRGGRDGH